MDNVAMILMVTTPGHAWAHAPARKGVIMEKSDLPYTLTLADGCT